MNNIMGMNEKAVTYLRDYHADRFTSAFQSDNYGFRLHTLNLIYDIFPKLKDLDEDTSYERLDKLIYNKLANTYNLDCMKLEYISELKDSPLLQSCISVDTILKRNPIELCMTIEKGIITEYQVATLLLKDMESKGFIIVSDSGDIYPLFNYKNIQSIWNKNMIEQLNKNMNEGQRYYLTSVDCEYLQACICYDRTLGFNLQQMTESGVWINCNEQERFLIAKYMPALYRLKPISGMSINKVLNLTTQFYEFKRKLDSYKYEGDIDKEKLTLDDYILAFKYNLLTTNNKIIYGDEINNVDLLLKIVKETYEALTLNRDIAISKDEMHITRLSLTTTKIDFENEKDMYIFFDSKSERQLAIDGLTLKYISNNGKTTSQDYNFIEKEINKYFNHTPVLLTLLKLAKDGNYLQMQRYVRQMECFKNREILITKSMK